VNARGAPAAQLPLKAGRINIRHGMIKASSRTGPDNASPDSGQGEGSQQDGYVIEPVQPGEKGPDSPSLDFAEDPGKAQVDPKKTILVVEDDLDTADSLKVKLEAQGYHVMTVFDGLHALEAARKIVPALVILDVMVPGLMGYHVCRLLKFDERFRKIPIIILTGKVDRESREIGTKAGANLYMTKPFELNDLLVEVRKFIR
jgi:CheY-like chemotaxis protein